MNTSTVEHSVAQSQPTDLESTAEHKIALLSNQLEELDPNHPLLMLFHRFSDEKSADVRAELLKIWKKYQTRPFDYERDAHEFFTYFCQELDSAILECFERKNRNESDSKILNNTISDPV